MSSAAAALQNDFKKRYKRAAKGLAAAVAKNGCFALQWKSPLTAINSAVAAVQKIPESRSALQSGCKVASNFKTKNVVPGNAYHSLVQKKEMQTSIIQYPRNMVEKLTRPYEE